MLVLRFTTSRVGRVVLDLLTVVWPFKSIRASRAAVRAEIRTLRSTLKSQAKLIVFVDLRTIFPGYGDFVAVIALVNTLFLLDKTVEFHAVAPKGLGLEPELPGQPPQLDKGRLKEILELASRFSSVPLRHHVSQIDFEAWAQSADSTIVFDNLSLGGKDFSQHCYALIGKIVSCRHLKVSKEDVRALFRNKQVDAGEPPSSMTVGFHVRGSHFDSHRNPTEQSVISDLMFIHSAFKGWGIKIFSDPSTLGSIMKTIASSPQTRGLRIEGQSSRSFANAIGESLSCDFWFQRLGGGIGAGVFFSNVPYFVISGDVPAVRLWRPPGVFRALTWRSSRQQLHLYPLRSRGVSLGFRLRRLAGTVSHESLP